MLMASNNLLNFHLAIIQSLSKAYFSVPNASNMCLYTDEDDEIKGCIDLNIVKLMLKAEAYPNSREICQDTNSIVRECGDRLIS
jgi:hypothetical protein